MLDLAFLTAEFMTKPVWMWAIFLGIVLTLLIIDLGILHKDQHEIGVRESLTLWGFYALMGVAFGVWVWIEMGSQAGMDYLTGFVVEESLSMDNLFVMAMVFHYFGIPRKYQHRVLFWGIMGVIILRAVMIGAGAALVSQFEWVLYIFALFLVLTGYKLLIMTRGAQACIQTRRPLVVVAWLAVCGAIAYAVTVGMGHMSEPSWVYAVVYAFIAAMAWLGGKIAYITQDEDRDLSDNPLLIWLRKHMRVTETLHDQKFLVRAPDPKTGKIVLFATPLLLALVFIEIADVIFAVDSVPAIFAITTDPYIVYTSNIFAILGLRSLYFALSAMIERFEYVKYSLSLVLIFIGTKVFVSDLLGWEKFPAEWSLGITLAILGSGFVYSFWKTKKG